MIRQPAPGTVIAVRHTDSEWMSPDGDGLWTTPIVSLRPPDWGSLHGGCITVTAPALSAQEPVVRDVSLLPTPTSQAAKHGETPDRTANAFGHNLWDLPHLLATPTGLVAD